MATSLSPINQLIDNIQGSVTGLVNQILGRSQEPGVPGMPVGDAIDALLSSTEQSGWMKLSFPYTFSVVNLGGASSPLVNPFTDFSLPIAPQSIKQTEEFAISIKPTQGGTTVTHSGNRYKTLVIKGTTGIAPYRGEGGVNRRTGEAIFQPNELKYRSGHEVFKRLRNYFRAYYEFKKINAKLGQDLRLVFKNYKDGEFLVVELLKFDMDRQAPKSFLYDYEMEFKVISHLSFEKLINKTTAFESAISQATEIIDTARGVFLRTQGILRQIEATYNSVILEPLRKTSLALKALQGVGTVAGDVGSRIIRNTVSEVNTLAIALGVQSQLKANRITGTLDPRIAAIKLPADLKAAVANQGSALLDSFNEGLMAMDSSIFPESTRNASAEEQSQAQSLPRSFYENTINEIIRVKQNAEDFFNLGDDAYDSLFNRTQTLGADFTKIITQDELDLLNALNDAVTGLRLMLATEDLFKSSLDTRIQDMINRFDGKIELFSTAAVRQITLEHGMTLERLAQKELGDSTRWGEIVEINGLKAPFITDDPQDTRSNLLKPGSKVLIPTPIVNGFSQVPAGKEIKTTRNLTELEKSLGTDLKLDANFDLSLSKSGDFEVISGANNMGQQVLLKLSYEKGEVMRYPELGAGVVPGTKFPPLDQIKDGVTNTLLQDNRIDRIEDLSITQESSALYLSFKLRIKQIDIPVPVKIKVA